MTASDTSLLPRAHGSTAALRLIAALLALPLAGCTSIGDYPSLARRPIELKFLQPPAPPPAPPPTMTEQTPGLSARIAGIVEQAQAAHRSFLGKLASAERQIALASGSAMASERWSV